MFKLTRPDTLTTVTVLRDLRVQEPVLLTRALHPEGPSHKHRTTANRASGAKETKPMSRIQRPLLLALLLGFVLSLAQLPAASAETVDNPVLRFCSITVRGLGYTADGAVKAAENILFANYFVTSYRVVVVKCDFDSTAHEMGLPTCYAELSACGFPKSPLFP